MLKRIILTDSIQSKWWDRRTWNLLLPTNTWKMHRQMEWFSQHTYWRPQTPERTGMIFKWQAGWKGKKKAAEWDLYPWRSWKKERFSECGKPPPWPGDEPAQTGSCRGAKPAHPALPGPGKRVQAEAGCWPPESRGQAFGQHCCWPHRDDPKGPACALATTSGAPALAGAREQTTAGCPCTELKPQLDPGAMRLRSRTAVSPHGSGSRQRPSLLAAV